MSFLKAHYGGPLALDEFVSKTFIHEGTTIVITKADFCDDRIRFWIDIKSAIFNTDCQIEFNETGLIRSPWSLELSRLLPDFIMAEYSNLISAIPQLIEKQKSSTRVGEFISSEINYKRLLEDPAIQKFIEDRNESV
jgi:hypothetical protein